MSSPILTAAPSPAAEFHPTMIDDASTDSASDLGIVNGL